MNGRPMGERFFLDSKISQSEARNFLPVKYANFVRCAFCVIRSHFFVSLVRFALPYPRIFLAVVHGIDESIRLSGSAVWLSTSAYSHFAAVCSHRTASAVRLVRGRDALTISDIGTISFVTCFSAEPHVASNVRYIACSLGMGPDLGSAEVISSHRQRGADVTLHSDEVDKKTP